MSLRLRLALAFSLMLLSALGGFGFAAHGWVARNTFNTVKQNLAVDADAIAEQLTISTNLIQQNNLGDVGDVEFETDRPVILTKTPGFTNVCTPDQQVQHLQDAVIKGDAFPVSDAGFDALLRGEVWSEVVDMNTTGLLQAHMVYNKPVFRGKQLIKVAQVAQSIEPQQASLMRLRDWLLLGGGTATVLMFGLTWVVSSQGLRKFGASLNTALQELRTANQHSQAQQEFVADVSHELRAPLTTVRGNLSLLQHDLSEADREAVLHDAVDEVERMSRLVNQLLMVARANSSTQTGPAFCHEAISLRPLIEEMARKSSRLMQGKLFSLRFAGSAANTATVLGNPDALKQVLLILLDNAAKFTPTGGQITLGLAVNASQAHISVQDNGAGIAPADLSHVFERGYCGANPCAGHGLGLSIAKQLVEAQGGQISATSQLGAGSAFTVALPLQ